MAVKKITENIGMILTGGMDSNMYLINGELLIDAGTGFHPKQLACDFLSLGAVFQDVKRIVLTHAHFDHIGGIGIFNNAKIGAHLKDAHKIESCDEKACLAHLFSSKMETRKIDFKLEEGDLIKSCGIRLEVIHTPGHTEGSICLFDRTNKILISGDTIFPNGVGRTDFLGGNSEELRESLKKLEALDIEKILPGHGTVVWAGGSHVIKSMLQSMHGAGQRQVKFFRAN